jgi:hypothetical protein
MFGRQAVDGNHDVEIPGFCPFNRNRPNRACDELDVYPALFNKRQDLAKFLKADERFTAHEGNVNGTMRVDESDHAVHELFPAIVTHLAEYGLATQVSLTVGITSRAR